MKITLLSFFLLSLFQCGYAQEFPVGIDSRGYSPKSSRIQVFIPPTRHEKKIDQLWTFLEEHNTRQPIEHLLMQSMQVWEMTDRDWEGLKKLKHLKSLDIMACSNFRLETLHSIGLVKNLKAFNILWTDMTDEDFQFIENASNLEELALIGSFVTDNGLAYLKKFHSMKDLHISKCPVTEEGVCSVLDKMRGLERLRLNTSICSEPSLEDRIRYSDRILQPVSKMKNLRELEIFSEKFTSEGVRYLSLLKKLQIVTLNICHTDESLKILCSLPEIQELDLSGNQKFTSDGLVELSKLPELRELSLIDCSQLTNENLSQLVLVKHLTDLNISYNPQLNDESVSALAQMPSLSELNISYCSFTKKGIGKLKKQYQKKKRNISIMNISD
ncbi:MAG: hypothetical protein Q4D62_10905 [Planctomycetia bacterium]|nr:hypothetical protein [Planctomycetia bacterium]